MGGRGMLPLKQKCPNCGRELDEIVVGVARFDLSGLNMVFREFRIKTEQDKEALQEYVQQHGALNISYYCPYCGEEISGG
jgi:predicted RNA-binding Zn-ribbon protein involved in translation (DUF1610 family)